MSALGPSVARTARALPARARQRSFASSSTQLRDLLARYRPMVTPSEIKFETTASVPVSPSIQEVPQPPASNVKSESPQPRRSDNPAPAHTFPAQDQASLERGKRTATPLPAMLPLSTDNGAMKVKPAPSQAQGMDVQGVWVPPKPVPPGEEECCMSGCVNCVYNIYADDTLAYNEALSAALGALESAHVPVVKWPPAISALHRKQQAKARGGKSSTEDVAEEQAAEEVEETMQEMDPALQAFLELEGKLKSKQRT